MKNGSNATEAKKNDVVLIYLGGQEDAKQRLAFLQMLLKEEDKPDLALLFLKQAPEQLRAFCERGNVAIIESKSPSQIADTLLEIVGE